MWRIPSTTSAESTVLRWNSGSSRSAVIGEVDAGSAEQVGAVVAARVHARCRADLLRGARFVNVPVKPHDRLVALDRVAHGPAADGDKPGTASADDRLERLVELGRDV